MSGTTSIYSVVNKYAWVRAAQAHLSQSHANYYRSFCTTMLDADVWQLRLVWLCLYALDTCGHYCKWLVILESILQQCFTCVDSAGVQEPRLRSLLVWRGCFKLSCRPSILLVSSVDHVIQSAVAATRFLAMAKRRLLLAFY